MKVANFNINPQHVLYAQVLAKSIRLRVAGYPAPISVIDPQEQQDVLSGLAGMPDVEGSIINTENVAVVMHRSTKDRLYFTDGTELDVAPGAFQTPERQPEEEPVSPASTQPEAAPEQAEEPKKSRSRTK